MRSAFRVNFFSKTDSETHSRTLRFPSNWYQRYPMVRGSHPWNISAVHACVRHLEHFLENLKKSAYPSISFKLIQEVPYRERISPLKYFRSTRMRSTSRAFSTNLWKNAYPSIFFKFMPEVPKGEMISPLKYVRGTRMRSTSRTFLKKISGKARTLRFPSNSRQRYPKVRLSNTWNIFAVHACVPHLEHFSENLGKSAYHSDFL